MKSEEHGIDTQMKERKPKVEAVGSFQERRRREETVRN